MLRTSTDHLTIVAVVLLLDRHVYAHIATRTGSEFVNLFDGNQEVDSEADYGAVHRKQQPTQTFDSAASLRVSEQASMRSDSVREQLRLGYWRDGRRTELPSLMLLALSRSASEAHRGLKCKLPGVQGNVISNLRNQGKVLYEDDRFSAMELKYTFSQEFFQGSISSAVLHAKLPGVDDPTKTKWSAASGWIFNFALHKISRSDWKKLAFNLEAYRKGQLAATVKSVPELIRDAAGKRISSRKIAVGHGTVVAARNNILDVTSTIVSIQRARVPQPGSRRLVLLTTAEQGSSLSMPFLRNGQLKTICSAAVSPELMIVSVRRCGTDDLGPSLAQSLLKRVKREFGENNRDRKNGVASATGEVKSFKRKRPTATASTICQRHPMQVRFDELGWSNWVIAPRSIQAYRCAGKCPYPLAGRMNGTNHAMLMTMMHSVEPSFSPLPCCVPVNLKPVSLLYVDASGNVVLRQYDDMIIESCGCR